MNLYEFIEILNVDLRIKVVIPYQSFLELN